jgi:hypothetical protein
LWEEAEERKMDITREELDRAFDERFPSAEIPDVIKVGFVICVVEDLKK